jgi:hypothetical protein
MSDPTRTSRRPVGRALAAAAALAGSMIAVACGDDDSPARPEPEAPARAGDTRFVSKRYGYALVLPRHYEATSARAGWEGGPPLADSGEVDVFTDKRDRPATPTSGAARFFVAAATRVRAGTTLRAWERSHAALMSELCQEKSRAFRATTLGGAAAREFEIKCPVHDAIVVVALHRGRGYTFQYVSPGSNSAAADRRSFEAGRRGFQFVSE